MPCLTWLYYTLSHVLQASFQAKTDVAVNVKVKNSKEMKEAKKRMAKKAEKTLAWFANDEAKEVSKKVARWVWLRCLGDACSQCDGRDGLMWT